MRSRRNNNIVIDAADSDEVACNLFTAVTDKVFSEFSISEAIPSLFFCTR